MYYRAILLLFIHLNVLIVPVGLFIPLHLMLYAPALS